MLPASLPQYALRYSCGHLADGTTGDRLGMVPAGWHTKDILAACPRCQPKPRRLPPRLRGVDYDQLPD